MFSGPKPFARLNLDGPDGNIFAVMARCQKLAQKAGKPEHEIKAFLHAVKETHSYDDALDVVRRWFNAKISD